MKIITFTDHGQDFSEWEVDSTGMVVSSKPFQGSIWGGGVVLNHATLKAGDKVEFKARHGSAVTIRYPVASVTERPSKFAIQRTLPGRKTPNIRYLTSGFGHWSKNFSKAKIFTRRPLTIRRNRKTDSIIEV